MDAPLPLLGDLLGSWREPPAYRPTESRTDLARRWASICGVLALHTAILTMLGLARAPHELSGAGGQYFEAINVEIVASNIIESRDKHTDVASGATSESVTGKSEAAMASSPTEARPKTIEPSPEHLKRPLNEEKPAQPQEKNAMTAVAVPTESERAASGAAAASPGAVQRYAAQVRAVLAKNKPAARGQRGTVTIAFGLSEFGKVRSSHIAKSSGHSTLDRAALAAVNRASFPRPPDGMPEEQLSYVVPFHFK